MTDRNTERAEILGVLSCIEEGWIPDDGSLPAFIANVRELLADRDRLDWLETKAVNVRLPGGVDLFWACPADELISEPSPLRAKIDASIGVAA